MIACRSTHCLTLSCPHMLPPYLAALSNLYRERGCIGCHDAAGSKYLRFVEDGQGTTGGSASRRSGTARAALQKAGVRSVGGRGSRAGSPPPLQACTDAAVSGTEAERRGHAPCCQLVTAPTDTTRGVPVPCRSGSALCAKNKGTSELTHALLSQKIHDAVGACKINKHPEPGAQIQELV
jgi:hypothetical protein